MTYDELVAYISSQSRTYELMLDCSPLPRVLERIAVSFFVSGIPRGKEELAEIVRSQLQSLFTKGHLDVSDVNDQDE